MSRLLTQLKSIDRNLSRIRTLTVSALVMYIADRLPEEEYRTKRLLKILLLCTFVLHCVSTLLDIKDLIADTEE